MRQHITSLYIFSADNVNRVFLRSGGVKGADYINASFIDVSHSQWYGGIELATSDSARAKSRLMHSSISISRPASMDS